MLRRFSIVSAVGLALLLSVVFLLFGYRVLVFFFIMFRNSGLLPSIPTELLHLAPFLVREYIVKHERSFDSRQFASIPIDGQHCFVYNSHFGVSRVTAVGTWIKPRDRWVVVARHCALIPWRSSLICLLLVVQRSYRMSCS